MRTLMGFSSSMLCSNDEEELQCVCVCVYSSCISKAWGAGSGFARRRWESIPRASRLISALCISKKWSSDFDTDVVTERVFWIFLNLWNNIFILEGHQKKKPEKWSINQNWGRSCICGANFVISGPKMCFQSSSMVYQNNYTNLH